MDSLGSLQSRSRAVKNVGQITKAMEVVAATKMRKAQETALKSRPYAFGALELLGRLSRVSSFVSPLAQAREVHTTLVIVVASDKGLTGAFNTQVFRALEKFFATDSYREASTHTYNIIAIGKKIFQYAKKRGFQVAQLYTGVGDYIHSEEVTPMVREIVEGFETERWDRVVAISTHFRTALRQEILVRQILPLDVERIRETVREIVPEHGRYADVKNGNDTMPDVDYIFEPDPTTLLESLIPHLVKTQLYHLILEANASEHSARRVAMKTASDNADELIGELTLAYNKARQAAITKEIIEITSTQSALA